MRVARADGGHDFVDARQSPPLPSEINIDNRTTLSARRLVAWLAILLAALLSGCATMPPGTTQPKVESTALAHPEDTALGRKIEPRAKAHPGLSAFRLFASGSDAL